MAAFRNIRWICGGLEKEGGLGSLSEPLETVRKAYVIGREAAQFAMKLGVEAEEVRLWKEKFVEMETEQ